MVKIKIKFADRTSYETEVSEEFAMEYKEIEKRENLINKKKHVVT